MGGTGSYSFPALQILTMCHRSPESWEHTCNLFHLNVTLQNAPEGEPGPREANSAFL